MVKQGGEASDYYNESGNDKGQSYPMQGGYEGQPGMQYQQYQQPPTYQNGNNANNGYGGNNSNNGYGGNNQSIAQQEMGGKNTFAQQFKIQKPKLNDLWASILFLIVFAGFVAVSGLSLQGYDAFKGFNGDGIYNNSNNFSLNTNTVVLFAFIVGMSLILGYGYILLARAFPKAFIWVTGILHIVFGLVTAIYMLVRHYYSGGIVFLLFSLFTAFCFYTWIPRIPFSALMLTTSIDVAKTYGHVYLVSFLGGLTASAFGAWFAVTLVAIYAKYEPNAGAGVNPACANGGGGCSTAIVIGLIAYATFSMYWISEVIKNVLHVTVSGVYGSWYFCPNNLPGGPTRGAFRRATTYSFGSICFGSLIVAIINAFRQLCAIAQGQASQSGDIVGAAAACCLGCLIGLLDWAVQFFNRYAFSHIALYGEAYIPAAKQTWQFIKDRGIDALVNECLLGPVLTMGSTFIGYACALLAYLYLIFTAPAYNSTGSFTPVVIAFAFLIGLQISQIFTTPISSGIDTIFVAMAWDPQVLMQEHPELYAKMVQVYPHVQQAVQARPHH